MFDVPEGVKGSHSKFRKAALSTLKSTIEKVISEHREEWNEITLNMIFNEGQKKLNRERESKEEILSKVLEGFFEIESSYNSLNEAPVFLQRFPGKLPSKSKYLEFVITSYFNEVYILSKRLEAYTKKILRLYKTSPGIATKINLLNSLNQKLTEQFNIINTTRSRHVHKNRFRDDDLNRLIYLEILISSQSSLSKIISPIHKKALKENKKKWSEFFQANNDLFEKILEYYFYAVHSVVFDDKGNFMIPMSKVS